MSFWNGHRWEAQTPPTADVKAARPSRAKRVGVAVLEAALITALTFGLIAGATFAAKGGNRASGGSAGISLDDASTLPAYGERIHFNVSTSNSYPVVSVYCSQGGSLVYGDSRPYYWPNPWNDPGIFTLSSVSWTDGAAKCTADLRVSGKNRVSTIATVTFDVNP